MHAMPTTLHELRAGEITPEEVARRIEKRIRERAQAEDACAKPEKRQFRSCLKVCAKAPVPFPTSVVCDAGTYHLKKREHGVAIYGEDDVVVETLQTAGFVRGQEQIVDIVTRILVGDVEVHKIDACVYL